MYFLQVSDLESQIDNFEAEIEGLSIKKGKQRPPRLVRTAIFIPYQYYFYYFLLNLFFCNLYGCKKWFCMIRYI
jgi:hypothetical protein